MSGDYEEAFEKWLGNSSGEKISSVARARQLESTSHDRLHPPNSAPFLVDDDEEQETGEYFKNLCTGPPVLEPVTHHPPDRNLFDAVEKDTVKHPEFTAKQSSASDKSFKVLEKPFKTYSAYGNTHKSPPKKKVLQHESQMGLKSSGGNIFDKLFSPASGLYIEDSPPPLIPSPKAMAEEQQLLPQGETGGKYAMKSPDFCAMEADSTSELQSSSKDQDCSDKKGNGELSLECDSTCMLGGSPFIVSPASNSTCGDMEEARDSSDRVKLNRTVEIQCNADSLDEKPCVIEKSISEMCNIEGMPDDIKNSPSTEVNKTSKPCLEDKSVGVDFTNSNTPIGFSNEPPALSNNCLYSKQQQSRRKRHTLDSVETFSKSRKINDDSDSILTGPPPLLHMEKADNSLSPSQGKSKGKKSKSSCTSKNKVSSDLNRSSYKRSYSAPVPSLNLDAKQYAHALWQLSQLQTRMHTLLSKLWPTLQLDMTPESPLFSSLITDLVTMLETPDIKIEDEQMEPSPMDIIPTTPHAVTNSSLGLPNPLTQSSLVFSSIEEKRLAQEPAINRNMPSPNIHTAAVHSDQHTENNDKHSSSPGAVFCSPNNQITPHSNPTEQSRPLGVAYNTDSLFIQSETSLQEQHPVNTSHRQQSLPPHLPGNTAQSSSRFLSPCDTECPLSGLSKLSLADGRELCSRPVSIVLPRDPDPLLADFSSLSCKVLQLLLPNVAVSLTNELSHSPKALIAFIDNVLAVNEKASKPHRKKV
ncbi:hypothetical protein EGW08_001646 [Elysia chlorotica]|uniref:Uncharacterized protein n=1 Tax=Elysia chlorotica TaxID=188477 RepID=A0A433U9S3_ELYCH|nr:hypothetical protein EGW08_001646 [Elysia chlorotica]